MKHRSFDSRDILNGEPAALARAITSLERADDEAAGLREWLRPHVGGAFRVAFTGPGGVGKSSLLREVARRLLRAGERVGVVAVDPASRLSSGALLGDRCRFGELQAEPALFLRSVAHRGTPGTLPESAEQAADVLDAGGFTWLLLESVGTGQMDRRVSASAQREVLVVAPHCGDDVQMLKAGAFEEADLIAVTHCDEPGGAAWARRLAEALGREGPREDARAGEDAAEPRLIFPVSAASGDGVDELVERLQEMARSFREIRRAP